MLYVTLLGRTEHKPPLAGVSREQLYLADESGPAQCDELGL